MGVEPFVVDSALQAKAEQKREFVQEFIRSIENALATNSPEDRGWLRNMCDPSDPCFATLLQILVEPKYQGFVGLHCVSLRAVQLILRIAAQFVSGRGADHSVGMALLLHLVGEELANRAFAEIHRMARGTEPNVACNALLLLGELGPEALPPQHVRLLLEIIVALPERADDLVEVALRAHAWGGKHRRQLLAETVAHPGGQLLCEVLLQVVNRAELVRRMRAVKVLGGCLALPDSEKLLYTNDARVLVEILLRELPAQAKDETSFACHADCFQVLAARCRAAHTHRKEEAQQVLQDLLEDDQSQPGVQAKCAEVLAALAKGGA